MLSNIATHADGGATARGSRPLTVDQAAEALNVSRFTVRAWIQQRRIGVLRLGRSVRVPMQEIDRLMAAGYAPATERLERQEPDRQRDGQ